MEQVSNYIEFLVLEQKVYILSFMTSHGISTVAEINSRNYYLGNTEPDVTAAVLAWQYENNRFINDDEFEKVINDNAST